MGGKRRGPLDARSWREVMLRFGQAGATVSEFCEREGLNKSSFYRWRERFGPGDDAADAAPRRDGRSQLSVRSAGFIDLGQLSQASRDAGASLELCLDLGGGVVLQIVRR
jgi:Transposase